jgi:hypothetical protein
MWARHKSAVASPASVGEPDIAGPRLRSNTSSSGASTVSSMPTTISRRRIALSRPAPNRSDLQLYRERPTASPHRTDTRHPKRAVAYGETVWAGDLGPALSGVRIGAGLGTRFGTELFWRQANGTGSPTGDRRVKGQSRQRTSIGFAL